MCGKIYATFDNVTYFMRDKITDFTKDKLKINYCHLNVFTKWVRSLKMKAFTGAKESSLGVVSKYRAPLKK